MKIYFVGICGVLMAPLAIALKERGEHVEGSDKGFYPPMSTVLQKNDVTMHIGYKPEHIPDDLDFAIIGAGILPTNPEFEYIKQKNIPYYLGFAPVLEKYFVKENSIVVVGTYGKTTITGFLTYLLEINNNDPTYAIGGIPLNEPNGVRLTDSEWSVIEGDEYLNSRVDLIPKFMFYHPSLLVINAMKYDHMDFYKTEDDYINAFVKVMDSVPNFGKIIINSNGENILKAIERIEKKDLVILVGTEINQDMYDAIALESYEYNEHSIEFVVRIIDKHVTFTTPLIGIHNVKNLVMGIACAVQCNIPLPVIQQAVAEYKGIRRRLEIRKEAPYIVIDDLAHSPVKAQSSLHAVKEKYPHKKIIAVFEPHTLSARLKSSLPSYTGYFADADSIFVSPVYHPQAVPHDEQVTAEQIAEAIGKNAQGFHSFDALKEKIKDSVNSETILIFMTSGNMGGLIEAFS